MREDCICHPWWYLEVISSIIFHPIFLVHSSKHSYLLPTSQKVIYMFPKTPNVIVFFFLSLSQAHRQQCANSTRTGTWATYEWWCRANRWSPIWTLTWVWQHLVAKLKVMGEIESSIYSKEVIMVEKDECNKIGARPARPTDTCFHYQLSSTSRRRGHGNKASMALMSKEGERG